MDGAGKGRDYFTLFDLPAQYEVDTALLTQRYRALQQLHHPDHFATAGESERRQAVQRSAELNDAFQTLKDPLKRARYLLAQAGIATDDETDTVMDRGFLMQQLEWRERLEESRTRPAEARALVLASLASEVAEQFQGKRVAFTGAWSTDGARARTLVREMQFLQRLASEVASVDEDF